MKKRANLKLTCLAALIGLALAGVLTASCGGPTSPTAGANLRLLLTDAPIPGVSQVNVYFTSVTVKPVGQSPQELDLALQLPQNPVDLLTLANQVVGFAAGVVPPGDYEFIHINIDPAQSNLMEDVNGQLVTKSLQVPSQEIKILGGFTVAADQTTTLTLDFDAAASLVSLGNGQWLLKPVIVRAGNNNSSS